MAAYQSTLLVKPESGTDTLLILNNIIRKVSLDRMISKLKGLCPLRSKHRRFIIKVNEADCRSVIRNVFSIHERFHRFHAAARWQITRDIGTKS